MRIADVVFRQGHLSEDALNAALLTGERPPHLEQCDECSRRARELSLWLADLRAEGLAAADEAFPAERLALQQAQIMRRLEQLDAPPRVIAFPAHAVGAPRTGTGRRVAPAWVGVAAAAGLVIGLVGGQMSARRPEATTVSAPPVETQDTVPMEPVNASLLDYDLYESTPDALLVYDQLTPTLAQEQLASAR